MQRVYTAGMDRLWTPWRYAYVTKAKLETRKGVPEALMGYPDDHDSVFLNLIGAVRWAAQAGGFSQVAAEKAGHVLLQGEHQFAVLNAFPYNSGHLMILPYEQTDSLAKLSAESAAEMIHLSQRMETALRAVYTPDGREPGHEHGRGRRRWRGGAPAHAPAAAVVWRHEFYDHRVRDEDAAGDAGRDVGADAARAGAAGGVAASDRQGRRGSGRRCLWRRRHGWLQN